MKKRTIKYSISSLSIVIIAVSLFVIFLLNGFLNNICQFLSVNTFFNLLFSIIVFYCCTRIKQAKTLFTLLIIFILIAIPISYYWSNAISTQQIIGGLIPHRDSKYYYLNALDALNGRLFDNIIAGRPLFPALLAFLLMLSGGNIQVTIIILAVLCAFSFYFLFSEIQIEFAPIPSAIFMSGMYVFYTRWTFLLMSEQSGIMLAMLGLALLIYGIRRKKDINLLIGILIITLALNARAGAMFVLPALAIFAGFFSKKKRFSMKYFGGAIAVIFLGFMINFFVFKLLSDPNIMPYSSFSNTLYGQSKGGAGWTIIQKDFPGLIDTREIMDLALMNIKRYPLGFVIGTIKAYRDFFLPGIDYAFVFITGYYDSVAHYLIWSIAWFFIGYELIKSFRNINKLFHKFELLVFAGILLSVPFAPPIDSSSMRTYAATIPMLMLLFVSGLSHFLNAIGVKRKIHREIKPTTYPYMMVVYSIFLIAIIAFPPIFLKLFVKPAFYLTNKCTNMQIPAVFHLNKGSYITLIPDGSAPCSGVPNICFSKFVHNSYGGVQELHDAILEAIKTPKEAVIFAVVPDVNTGRYFHILLNQKDLPISNTGFHTISACLTEINHTEFLYTATDLRDAITISD